MRVVKQRASRDGKQSGWKVSVFSIKLWYWSSTGFQFFNIKLLNCTTCQGLDLHSTTYSKLLTQVDVKLSFLGANSTQLHAASHGCEATPIRCQWPIPWHAPVPPSPGTPSSSLVRKVHRKVRKGRMERVRNWGNGTHHPTPLLTSNGLILRPTLGLCHGI